MEPSVTFTPPAGVAGDSRATGGAVGRCAGGVADPVLPDDDDEGAAEDDDEDEDEDEDDDDDDEDDDEDDAADDEGEVEDEDEDKDDDDATSPAVDCDMTIATIAATATSPAVTHSQGRVNRARAPELDMCPPSSSGRPTAGVTS
jgi:hypothetical protein